MTEEQAFSSGRSINSAAALAGLAVGFNDSEIAQRVKDSKFHPGSLSNSPTSGAGLRSPESRRDFLTAFLSNFHRIEFSSAQRLQNLRPCE
jgi:hypothetical protein